MRQVLNRGFKSLQHERTKSSIYTNNPSITQNYRGKKATEEVIKKAEFNFMIDINTLIAKSTTDAELNRVRDAMRRAETLQPQNVTDQYSQSYQTSGN